jgi:hypothetical protein
MCVLEVHCSTSPISTQRALSQAEIDELARKVHRHNHMALLFKSANVPLDMEWKKLEKEENE